MLHSLVLLIFLTSGGIAFAAQAPGEPSSSFDRKAIAHIAEAISKLAREAENAVPLELLEPKALAKRLKKPEEIFRWISHNSALVPYKGLLRGAKGVLQDRLGNSLDRALLLSTLLAEAGHQVRLANAELDNATATQLLDMTTPVSGAPSAFNLPDANTRLPALLKGKPVDVEKVLQALAAERAKATGVRDTGYRRYEVISPALLKLALPLADDSLERRIARERAAAVEQLKDHWWVQFKRGAEWIDLDPTLLEIGKAHGTPASTIAPREVPADLRHKVTMRVVIDVATQGDSVPACVFEHAFEAAEVAGKTLVLTHYPVEMLQRSDLPKLIGEPDQAAALVKRLKHWLPVVYVDGKVLTDKVFSVTGEVWPAEPARLNAISGGDFPGAAAKGAFRGGIGLFDSLPGGETKAEPPVSTPSEPGVVVGVRLEYIIHAPGQPEESQKRTIVRLHEDQTGQPSDQTLEVRAWQERAVALLGTQRIGILVARPSEASLARIITARTKVLASALGELARGSELSAHAQTQSETELTAYSALRWDLSAVADQLFLDRPNVVAIWDRAEHRKNEWVGMIEMDIVANGIGVRLSPGTDPYQVRVVQGVADTVAESLVFGKEHATINTAVSFEEDLRKGESWSVNRASDERSPDRAAGDGEKQLDVQAGYVVIAPASATTNTPQTSWRIDPRTGHTLGVSVSGAGASTVDYIKITRLVIQHSMCYLTLGLALRRGLTEVGSVVVPASFLVCATGTIFGSAAVGGSAGIAEFGSVLGMLGSLINFAYAAIQ